MKGIGRKNLKTKGENMARTFEEFKENSHPFLLKSIHDMVEKYKEEFPKASYSQIEELMERVILDSAVTQSLIGDGMYEQFGEKIDEN